MNLSAWISTLRLQLFAALVIGGLVGWFSMFTQDGTLNVAISGAQLFLGLGIALPVALVACARLVPSVTERRVLVVSAVIGAPVGIIVYIGMVALTNGAFGGEDLNAVRSELANQIPIWQYLVVVAVNIVVGVLAPIKADDMPSS